MKLGAEPSSIPLDVGAIRSVAGDHGGAPRRGGCPKAGRVSQGGEDAPRDAQLPVVAVLVESSVFA